MAVTIDWASCTEEELREIADGCRHDNDDGSEHYFAPEAANWYYVSVRPEAIEAFDSVDVAKAWITEEIANFRQEGNGRAEAYEHMLAHGFDEPVVLGTTLTSTAIWDGWHRTAIAMVRRTDLPAIVGIPHAVPWLDTAPAGIESTMLVHCGLAGHDMLLLGMQTMQRQRPDLAESIQREFQCIAYFYEDAPGELGELARDAIRRSECTAAQDAIMASHGGDLAGLQLVSERGQGALFSPDASEPGRFRVTLFDERGFFGHFTRDTYAELIAEAFQDGYRTPSPGTFERYSASTAFSQGNAWVAELQAVNNGIKTLGEVLASRAAPAPKAPAPSN